MPNQTRHCKLDLGNPGFRAHHWILRPFFGTPGLEVAFLRADPMRGTFYEIIWRSMSVITSGHPIEGFVASCFGLFLLLIPLLKFFTDPNPIKS